MMRACGASATGQYSGLRPGPVLAVPDTRYAPCGHLHIAYQTVGEGPFDLAFVPSWFSNVEVLWESPMVARFLDRLASFSRLILFDRRGSGLSDSCDASELTLANRASDLIAVLDAAGSDRAALVGSFLAGPVVAYVAANLPERVSALAFHNATAYVAGLGSDVKVDGARTPASVEQARRAALAVIADTWGHSSFGLSEGISDRHAEWWQRYQRHSLAPGDAIAGVRATWRDDVRDLLGAIRVPTLVVANRRSNVVPVSDGKYLAEHIDGARYLEFEGDAPGWLLHIDDPVLDEVQEFLIGNRAELEPDRALATILFTDLVGSTAFAVSAGDAGWRDAIDTHDRMLEDIVERHGGVLIKTTGDGALVTFDRPSSAIRCGRALTDEAERLGFQMRVGIHTGEIDHREGDVAGVAVVIAARTMQLAPPNQVVVTGTVRDLVAGSSVSFFNAGVHELKGVAGTWPIWQVASQHR
jgi:class 3 adenylate cyclase